MPSPFPGMDPYLEGHLWPDVHHRLAGEIGRQLAPRIRPKYVARLDVSVEEDENPEAEIGIVYPDVQVLRRRMAERLRREGAPAAAPEGAIAAPLVIPAEDPIEVRLVTVQVRDVKGDQLVTAIEIVSPVNKREPGLTRFRRKRNGLRQAGVHWIELDLLRRGSRTQAGIPDCEWVVTLTRGGKARTGVWPLGLRDALPVVPVPLLPPDPDVPLDLGTALRAIYDEAAYDLSLDYGEAPPTPPLSRKDAAWMRRLLGSRRRR